VRLTAGDDCKCLKPPMAVNDYSTALGIERAIKDGGLDAGPPQLNPRARTKRRGALSDAHPVLRGRASLSRFANIGLSGRPSAEQAGHGSSFARDAGRAERTGLLGARHGPFGTGRRRRSRCAPPLVPAHQTLVPTMRQRRLLREIR
jgi:hypothetical protein